MSIQEWPLFRLIPARSLHVGQKMYRGNNSCVVEDQYAPLGTEAERQAAFSETESHSLEKQKAALRACGIVGRF